MLQAKNNVLKSRLTRLGLLNLADQFAVSSLHLTFNTAEESNALADVGYLQRSGIQYHWENRGYTTFEDFLADLKQSKRKNIRQVL